MLASGNVKLRVTVMLTARHDGARCKPFVLLPYRHNARCRTAIEEKFGRHLHLVWENTTWMNNGIVGVYLRKLFGGLL